MLIKFIKPTAVFSLGALAACSSESTNELGEIQDPLINCGTELGVAPLQNSCGHGWEGPFGDSGGVGTPASPVVADATAATATQLLDELQVTYSLTLPGSGTNYQGAVLFDAPFTQDYAFVVDEDMPIEILDATDTTIVPVLQQNIGPACADVGAELGSGAPGSAMQKVDIVPLVAGQQYRIVLGNTDDPDVRLLIDEPNEFLNLYFADSDGDGFGDPFAPVVSECVAPTGYVPTTGDCDDTNMDVNPNAVEEPDTPTEIDNDCDGLLDGEAADSDLEMVSVTASGVAARIAVGASTSVIVTQVVTNNSPTPTDAIVTRSASSSGGSITPASSFDTLNNVELGEYRTLHTAYDVSCDAAGTTTFTVEAEVSPANAIDTDPDLSNNVGEVIFSIDCVPCVQAADRLVFADDTQVTTTLAQAGGYFELGAAPARVTGNVEVAGDAFLRNGSVIDGNLTLTGMVIDQGGPTSYDVTGDTFYEPVEVPAQALLTVSPGTSDLAVAGGASASWTPGAYDEGSISPFGSATLTAGTYEFRTLRLHPDATLYLDTSAGDVRIFTEEQFEVEDRATLENTGSGLVGVYTNAPTVRIGTDSRPFDATLFAPNAAVHVYSRTDINGCMSAHDITFEPQVTLIETDLPSMEEPTDSVGGPGGTCDDGIPNGDETGTDCGGSCPPCAPACEAADYDVATEMNHSAGGMWGTAAWNLWSNGNVSTTHSFTAGPSKITVSAFGETAFGVAPHMIVRVDGVSIGDVYVPQTPSFESYDFFFNASGGNALVEVVFDNDVNSGGQDRNLILQTVSVDCEEAPEGEPELNAWFVKTSDWYYGYCVDIYVTNTGTGPTMTWQATVNTQQSTIYDTWNGSFMGTTGSVNISPTWWNSVIAPGQTISSVGFCANRFPGTNNNATLTAVVGY